MAKLTRLHPPTLCRSLKETMESRLQSFMEGRTCIVDKVTPVAYEGIVGNQEYGYKKNAASPPHENKT